MGWIYQYALVDRSGRHDLGELRALQDWFLKYELKAVPNVAEVASVGGMVRQYQIVLDPDRLRAYGIPHTRVIAAMQNANRETGGSVVELGEAEYMVRASGYLKTLDDFRADSAHDGQGRRAGDCCATCARVQIGPEMRRGIAELDGEGEVAGGVIIMRSGKNALETIDGGQGEARETQAKPAARRRDRRDLRPLQPDRARGEAPARQAARGIRRRGAGVPRVPVPSALGVRRHRLAAAGRA